MTTDDATAEDEQAEGSSDTTAAAQEPDADTTSSAEEHADGADAPAPDDANGHEEPGAAAPRHGRADVIEFPESADPDDELQEVVTPDGPVLVLPEDADESLPDVGGALLPQALGGDAPEREEIAEPDVTVVADARVNDGLLDVLVSKAHNTGASDVHLNDSGTAWLRINGALQPIASGHSTAELVAAVEKYWPGAVARVSPYGETDLGGAIPVATASGTEVTRVRCSLVRSLDGMQATLRLVPTKIPTLEGLNVPPVIARFADFPYGLVLATGPVGSGKTTLIAAWIDHINRTRPSHIMTVEDPIEFVFTPDRSRFTQRSLGDHTESFPTGIRASRRSDPNVMLIGEIRGPEEAEAAVAAAASGILVFSTIHSSSTSEAVSALVAMMPAHRQNQVKEQLAEALRAVVTQRLVPDTRNMRTAVREILIATPGIRGNIRNGDFAFIKNAVSGGRSEFGMQLLEDDLAEKVILGMITHEEALRFSLDHESLNSKITARQQQVAAEQYAQQQAAAQRR